MSTQTTLLSLVFIGDQDHLDSLLEALHDHGFRVDKYSTLQWLDLHSNSKHRAPDVIFIDPSTANPEQLKRLIESFDLAHSLVIVSGIKGKDTAKIAGAGQYLYWPDELSAMVNYLNNTHAALHTFASNQSLRDEFVHLNLLGSSPVFLSTLRTLKKYSQYDAPVLIKGETGTGKEMVARAIHYLGERSDHPFIPVDCGAIPDSLVENELFGHERGAYTDARQSQRGLVAQADGGTLFLDEIDALSSKAQVTLLRFLQTREYRPLGSQHSKMANIRVITATNADLPNLVAEEAFRQDLLFRIDVLSLELPPLRQRLGDTEILARYFLENFRQRYDKSKQELHQDTLEWMHQYHWPGNVRELENFIHREFLLSDNGVIRHADWSHQHCEELHDKERRVLTDRRLDITLDVSFNEAKAKYILRFEKKYLRKLMQESCGNVTRAAKISGKERRSLGKLLKKHGINKDEFTSY